MNVSFRNGIPEDIDTVRRIPLGTFWGVRVLATSWVWLGPIIFFGLGLALDILRTDMSPADRVRRALIFSLVVFLTNILHAFGHILSGKMAGSAMDELLVASTRDVNLYHGDQSGVPGSVHVIRSLGGPLYNLLMAGLFYALEPTLEAGLARDIVQRMASVNLVFGVGGFLPIPTVDGDVIWREIGRAWRER